jgi:hypothetical protein
VIEDDNGDSVRMFEYVIAPYHDFYHNIVKHGGLHKIYNKSFPLDDEVTHTVQSINLRFNWTNLSGKVHISIKQDGMLRFAKDAFFNHGLGVYVSNISLNVPITLINNPDKPVYISCYIDDPALANKIDYCELQIDGKFYPCMVYALRTTYVLFGSMYGGWGQFLYQTDKIPNKNPMAIMDINKIKRINNLNPQNIGDFVDTTSLGDTIADIRHFAQSSKYGERMDSIRNSLFCLPMVNDPENKGYVGFYANSFIRGADMNIGGLPCPDFYEDDEDDPCEMFVERKNNGNSGDRENSENGGSRGGVPVGNVFAGMDSKKTSQTIDNTSFSFGVSLPGLNMGTSESSSSVIQKNDIMDLNGDGIPDIIRNDKKGSGVYYSVPKIATWETSAKPYKDLFGSSQSHHKSTSNSYGFSFTFGICVSCYSNVFCT